MGRQDMTEGLTDHADLRQQMEDALQKHNPLNDRQPVARRLELSYRLS
jgi:hypothetical protein